MHVLGCPSSKLAPRLLRRGGVIITAGKGFGKPAQPAAPPKKKAKPAGAAQKGRQRKSQFIEDEGKPRGDPQRDAVAERFRNTAEAQQRGDSGSDSAFERRLSQLAERTAGSQSESDDEASWAEPQRDLLAGGPQAAATQLPSRDSDDDAEEGPSLLARAAAVVGSLILVGVFIVTSVTGGSGSSTPATPTVQPQLGEEQKRELTAQADKFQQQLAESPDNVEALEGAAVSYATLGEVKKASDLLIKLTKAKPDDVEVWRLLAETQALQGDFAASAGSYQTANQKAGAADIDLLSAWTDSLLSDSKPQKAVEAVKAAKQRQAASSDKSPQLAVDLDLLLARVYAQWKGHDSEALAIYDALMESNPDDFRPPLAKGLILKGEGRKGDAARYFMKARYLAPTASRSAVEDLLARQQDK